MIGPAPSLPDEDAELYFANKELSAMSMDRCCRCNDPVDTDDDVDCYVVVGGIDADGIPWDHECVCERGRDKEEADIGAQYAPYGVKP